MAIKLMLPHFSIAFKGDGAASSMAVTLATAPIVFPNSSVSTSFSLTGTPPTAVNNLTTSNSQTVTARVVAGICTITWAVPIPANEIVYVSGNFEF